jgi:hypothetical protein
LSEATEIAIIIGAIIIILAMILVLRGQRINMRSHHKIQAVALAGLTLIAVVALVGGLFFKDNLASFIAVASTAAGGIAGFVGHKLTTPNRTILFPIKDILVRVGDPLNFSVAGISTAGYNLNYAISSKPELPEEAKFNGITGEFSWTPKAGDEREYNVTFTVTDGQGGTDSRTIKITVEKKSE